MGETVEFRVGEIGARTREVALTEEDVVSRTGDTDDLATAGGIDTEVDNSPSPEPMTISLDDRR
jgi:hypothetical protein